MISVNCCVAKTGLGAVVIAEITATPAAPVANTVAILFILMPPMATVGLVNNLIISVNFPTPNGGAASDFDDVANIDASRA